MTRSASVTLYLLSDIMNRAIQAEQKMKEEDFIANQGLVYPDTIPVRSQHVQEEEDYCCHGGTEADMSQFSWGRIYAYQTLDVVWGEEAQNNVGHLLCYFLDTPLPISPKN